MFYFAQCIKYLNQRFKEECVQYSKCTAPNDFDKNAKYCFINSPFIKKFRICGTGQKSGCLVFEAEVNIQTFRSGYLYRFLSQTMVLRNQWASRSLSKRVDLIK